MVLEWVLRNCNIYYFSKKEGVSKGIWEEWVKDLVIKLVVFKEVVIDKLNKRKIENWCMGLYYFFIIVVTNCYKFGGLK